MNSAQQQIYNSIKNNPAQLRSWETELAEQPIFSIEHGSVRSGKTFINNIKWLKHVAMFAGQKKNSS